MYFDPMTQEIRDSLFMETKRMATQELIDIYSTEGQSIGQKDKNKPLKKAE